MTHFLKYGKSFLKLIFINTLEKEKEMNSTLNSTYNNNNNNTYDNEQVIFNNVGNIVTLLVGLTIILLTITFNLFIIIAVITNKTMQNYTNIQFAFMSAADLLVGCIAMPSLLVSILYKRWPFGATMCAFWTLADFIGGNISICTLTIVSHHRLKCIKQPFATAAAATSSSSSSSSSSTNKKTKTSHSSLSLSPICRQSLKPSCVLWPLIVTFWSVPILYVTLFNRNKLSYAHMNENDCFFTYSFAYVFVTDLLAYVLPVVLLVYFQISIYVALLNNKKKSLASNVTSSGNSIKKKTNQATAWVN